MLKKLLLAGQGTRVTLPPTSREPASMHLLSSDEANALVFAAASRRPLLVRGEPGTGKSQLARAAAAIIGAFEPIVEVIHPTYEATDLLYRFDAVKRLSDAQLRGMSGDRHTAIDESHYVTRGPLWRAFEESAAKRPTTLLIDEIDKGDSDLANTLLDALGARSFQVPYLNGKTISADMDAWPLIIITTNEERELPAAFIRRCGVLNIRPPKDDERLFDWFDKRIKIHPWVTEVHDEARTLAIQMTIDDRRRLVESGHPPVGLAELLDLLRALHEVSADIQPAEARAEKQKDWIRKLSQFALKKEAAA